MQIGSKMVQTSFYEMFYIKGLYQYYQKEACILSKR